MKKHTHTLGSIVEIKKHLQVTDHYWNVEAEIIEARQAQYFGVSRGCFVSVCTVNFYKVRIKDKAFLNKAKTILNLPNVIELPSYCLTLKEVKL